jgi:hypothetical protein
MTTDMHAAATAGQLAWSECRDEPFFSDCDASLYSAPFDAAEPPPRWWTWPVVVTAWVAGAFAFAVIVGAAVAALTPSQSTTTPPQPQQPVTTWISPNAGTIVPFPTAEPAQNT